MKIAVLTFWTSNSNYGQILQCWALQEILKSFGHEPFVIRYSHHSYTNVWGIPRRYLPMELISDLRLLLKSPKQFVKRQKIKRLDRKRDFDLFRRKIAFSNEVYFSLEELQKYPPQADCYIVGSDQVWAQLLSSNECRAYYLDFGHKSIKRIAYAPSFSLEKYPDNLVAELSINLSRFNALSVREDVGKTICQQAGFCAEKVLDPTLLLDRQKYIESVGNIVEKKENQLLIYSINILNSEDIRWRELKEVSNEMNLLTKIIPSSGYIEGDELFGRDAIYEYPTVEKFLDEILQSKLFVTTSFHGIVFSILMHTPFVYVPLKGKFGGVILG